MGSTSLCSTEKTAKPCQPHRTNYFQLLESVILQLPVTGNDRTSYPAILEESVILESYFASKSIRSLVISVEPQT